MAFEYTVKGKIVKLPKVGQVVYTNGRNNQMGQGRVNALRAVQAASTFV